MFNRRRPPLYIRIIYAVVAVFFVAGSVLGIVFTALGGGDPDSRHEAAQTRIVEAREALKKDPKDVSALQDLAGAEFILAQPESEEATQPPNDAQRHISNAVAALEKAYKIDPDNTEVAEQLAINYPQLAPEQTENSDPSAAQAEKNAYGKAQEIWARLVEREPENSDYVYRWAESAQHAGNTSVAILAFQRYLKLAPDDTQSGNAREALKELTGPNKGAGHTD